MSADDRQMPRMRGRCVDAIRTERGGFEYHGVDVAIVMGNKLSCPQGTYIPRVGCVWVRRGGGVARSGGLSWWLGSKMRES